MLKGENLVDGEELIQGEEKIQEFSVNTVGCEVPISHLSKDVD